LILLEAEAVRKLAGDVAVRSRSQAFMVEQPPQVSFLVLESVMEASVYERV